MSAAASVVITNHDYGRYLREAVDSALAQTLPDVEVVVVDDGSTDDSPEIVASYGDAIVPVLKTCGGQTSAINAGAERSSGRFVELEREWRTGSAHADAFLVDLAGLLGATRELPAAGGTYRVHDTDDWATLGAAAKLERIERAYHERCARLAAHCERRGLAVDRPAWERESWLMRTIRVKRELESIPAGEALTLVDDNPVDQAVLGERPATPFMGREGEYWGTPADDHEAIRELERVREQRGGFLAILWPAFWWFESYPGFVEHLERTAPCAIRTDDLRVYEVNA